jgi:hypothetical protein
MLTPRTTLIRLSLAYAIAAVVVVLFHAHASDSPLGETVIRVVPKKSPSMNVLISTISGMSRFLVISENREYRA